MEAKFFRFLKIVGVGFKARAESEGRLLYLKLGYSHEVELSVPPAVRVCKPPEVYKGKGIIYVDEVIKKMQGKKSK
ncbi:hypothetical protein IFM89_000655 [Coptis chinensis]|uniref:Ribosomal protein L6 n=1 Tax=Coptis chinensis TaxID=261450 RepID=A0A835II29_9MAGN|nr:hypothetical protein IFM89_000655 [Coptis chinensis]